MKESSKYLHLLKEDLQKFEIQTVFDKERISFSAQQRKITFLLGAERLDNSAYHREAVIPLDYLITRSEKVVSVIVSQLKLNKTIFARRCEIRKVNKEVSADFLNRYHIIGSTQSSCNYGLFYKNDIVALASFSKGRRMNRLPAHERSYEMIRFCCKSGITVIGGLSKLIKNFCRIKKAGDIMTYVDKQWSDGGSFIKAGFKKHSETEANYFLVSKKTFERQLVKDKNCIYEKDKFYLVQNAGNIKLIYKL